MKKEEIIKKTQHMLIGLDHNVGELSLNTILQNLGISKGSFYYHFKNKDDLLYQTISPAIKKHTEYLRHHIKKLNNLKDQIYLLFEPFVTSDNEYKLEHLQNFYIYLFFNKNLNTSKVFKKLYIEISNNRKSLLAQSVKSNGMKIDKTIKLLLNYIDNTMVFYHIRHKKLYDKNPQKEIADFLDAICSLIEKQHKNKNIL